MTTIEAIKQAKENQGVRVELLSLSDTYIYTKDGLDFSLIIEGSFNLGFAEEHADAVDEDLAFYTKTINWLPIIKYSNVGTTATYNKAWKRGNKLLETQLRK